MGLSDEVDERDISSVSLLSEKRTRCLLRRSDLVLGSETPSTLPVLVQPRPPKQRAAARGTAYGVRTHSGSGVRLPVPPNRALMDSGSVMRARATSLGPITSIQVCKASGPLRASARIGAVSSLPPLPPPVSVPFPSSKEAADWSYSSLTPARSSPTLYTSCTTTSTNSPRKGGDRGTTQTVVSRGV